MEDERKDGFEELKKLCGEDGTAAGKPAAQEEASPAQTEQNAPTQEEAQPAETEQGGPAQEGNFVLQLSDEELDGAPVLEEEEPNGEELHTEDGADEKSSKKRRREEHRVSKTIFYTVLVIGVSVLLSVGILLSANDIFAFSKPDRDVQVEIPRNASTKTIARILKENDIINYSLLFRLISKTSNHDGTYQYGLYTLNPSMSYEQLMDELQKTAPKKDVVSVTITEGMTLRQIAALLEENGILTRRTLFIRSTIRPSATSSSTALSKMTRSNSTAPRGICSPTPMNSSSRRSPNRSQRSLWTTSAINSQPISGGGWRTWD